MIRTCLIIMLLMLSGCDPTSSGASQPVETTEAAISVPEEAIYVGGADGGVYFLLSEENPVITGTVYTQNGVLWYQGAFEYTGETAVNFHDPGIYNGWDGDAFYLRNGEALKASP